MPRTKRKHRPLHPSALLHRLPRAFRPRMPPAMQDTLELSHLEVLDALHKGTSDAQMLWDWVGALFLFSFIAEELKLGIDEITPVLTLSEQVILRFNTDSRVKLTDTEYPLAVSGVDTMRQLASLCDHRTAIAAAEWAQVRVNQLVAAYNQTQEPQP